MIDSSEVRKAIINCDLFKQLSTHKLDELLGQSRVIELDEGEILIHQGQPAAEFFLMLDGEMKLAATSQMGLEKILHIIKPGHTFAEVMMFLEKPAYPVNAQALLPSRVVAFPNKLYKSMLGESIDACFNVLADYSVRIRHLVGEIEALTLHNATFRVIYYLLQEIPSHQYGSTSVELRTPKHAIASRLSMTPETLSRIFSKLKRDGVIDVSDKRVILLDVDWMRKFISKS